MSQFDEAAFGEWLAVPYSFVSRPAPVPGDARVSWRLALLVALLKKCHGGTASFEQLHVLSWASRTPQTRSTFISALRGALDPNEVIARFDPIVNRSVDLAVGLGLIEWTATARVRLTGRGREFAEGVAASGDLMTAELAFLEAIPGKVSHSQIERLVKGVAG